MTAMMTSPHDRVTLICGMEIPCEGQQKLWTLYQSCETLLLMWRSLLIIQIFFFSIIVTSTVSAAIEIKSSLLPSVAIVGKSDLVLSSHNTLLFGGPRFKVGPYIGYEVLSSNQNDLTYGAAIRFGDQKFLEIQGGIFERDFHQQNLRLKGKGFAGNLIFGVYLNNYFGIDLALTYKRIESGMDKRTVLELLPFFGLKAEF